VCGGGSPPDHLLRHFKPNMLKFSGEHVPGALLVLPPWAVFVSRTHEHTPISECWMHPGVVGWTRNDRVVSPDIHGTVSSLQLTRSYLRRVESGRAWLPSRSTAGVDTWRQWLTSSALTD